jgi:hypothetical protein
MANTVETLIISGNKRPTDIEALKAIYGSGATVRVANDAAELVGAISSYASITKLVIATHGSEGDVIIRGVHTSIKKLTETLMAARHRPRITESIVFDGCNVAGESKALVAFMAALDAPKLSAFASTRLWWYDDYLLPKGSEPAALATLKKKYEFFQPYLVAGQLPWQALLGRAGLSRVWYEAFSRTQREPPRTEADKRVTLPRSKLEIRSASANDVTGLDSETARVAGPLLQIEIIRP